MRQKIWITNGSENTRIDSSRPIPIGWKKGRSNFPKYTEKQLARSRLRTRLNNGRFA